MLKSETDEPTPSSGQIYYPASGAVLQIVAVAGQGTRGWNILDEHNALVEIEWREDEYMDGPSWHELP